LLILSLYGMTVAATVAAWMIGRPSSLRNLLVVILCLVTPAFLAVHGLWLNYVGSSGKVALTGAAFLLWLFFRIFEPLPEKK
jgi:hypothetical protein